MQEEDGYAQDRDRRAAARDFRSAGLVADAAAARAAAIDRRRSIERSARQLDPIFAALHGRSHVPGLVYGIVADGRLAYVRTFGSRTQNPAEGVTPDTLFRIASMSKAFTALAILKLRDEGRLRLDALAEDYVPELRNWRYPTSEFPAHPGARSAQPCRRLRHRRSLGRSPAGR